MAKVKVLNKTAGPIFIDRPDAAAPDSDADPVAALLKSVTAKKEMTTDDAVRALIATQLSDRMAAQAAREAAKGSARRANETIDLWPAYQGQGKPALVNEVDRDLWKRVATHPTIAARLATGEIVVQN